MSQALQALYEGDVERGRALLPEDASITVHEAAAFGRCDRLAAILDADPAEVAALHDGFTPLHLAIFGRQEDACRLLIERGADLDVRSSGAIAQVPPLGTAAFVRATPLARLLLDAGADPNGSGVGGFTALHTAAVNGDVELVQLLLERGADPSRVDGAGKRPRDLATDERTRALLG